MDALKKEKMVGMQEADELRESKGRAEYERDGLEARSQRAEPERGKGVDTVNGVQSGVGESLGLLKKNSDDLQIYMEKYWVKMCVHQGTLLVVRVVKSRKDRICEFRDVAGLYVHSLENRLRRTKRLVQKTLASKRPWMKCWDAALEITVEATLLSSAQVS